MSKFLDERREPTEEDFIRLRDKLKAANPHFDLMVEYGKFLMKHISDLTESEKDRMKEIEAIITPKPHQP